LQKEEGDLVAGFTLEFKDRQDGYVGMQELYNLDIKNIRTMEPGVRQKALKNGEVDIIDAYATDSYMIELNLKTLQDSENIFQPYKGDPLLMQETLKTYPELENIINQQGGEITDQEMREMNYEVDYKDNDPEQVARDYLQNRGLIK